MATNPQHVPPVNLGPPGVSGKRVTIWVLIALMAIGVSLSYTLWTYNRLDTLRRESTVAWRVVTEHLAKRYRGAEKIVATGVDSRQLKMEFGEKFRLAIDAFRTTSLPEEQRKAAERLEQLLTSAEFAPLARSLEDLSSGAETNIAEYNLAREREKQVLESWGGRLLDVFLKFDTPRPFGIASAVDSNSGQ